MKKTLSGLGIIILLISTACNNKQADSKKSTDTIASAVSNNSSVQPASPPANFKHANATVNGVNIHYVIGGEGEPLILIHGLAPLTLQLSIVKFIINSKKQNHEHTAV